METLLHKREEESKSNNLNQIVNEMTLGSNHESNMGPPP